LNQGYYEILGVSPDADFKALKKAYYRLAKETHPDRFGGSKEKERQFKEIVHAFDVLSDPVRRSEYDRSIAEASDEVYTPAIRSVVVMDSDVDDTLEELIVGNSPPRKTTIATIFADLTKTEQFIKFREAKNYYYQKRFSEALPLLTEVVLISSNNIVYRCFLARTLAVMGSIKEARKHYRLAISLGELRNPPQELDRIRHELETVNKHHRPFWSKVTSFFAPKKEARFFADPSGDMIDEVNRSMEQLLVERSKKNRKRLR